MARPTPLRKPLGVKKEVVDDKVNNGGKIDVKKENMKDSMGKTKESKDTKISKKDNDKESKVDKKGIADINVCEHCNRKFASSDKLKEHLYSHTKEKHFACDQCGHRLAYKRYLDNHMRTKHKDTDQKKSVQDANSARSPANNVQKGKERVVTREESDSDSEMMSLIAKYGEHRGSTEPQLHTVNRGNLDGQASISVYGEATIDDSDSDAEMMLLNAKNGDGHDSQGKKTNPAEAEPTGPQLAMNSESDSDSEMMSLLAKHGDSLGGQKGKEKVATREESDSDSEMMSLISKYGEEDKHYQPVVALKRLPSKKSAMKRPTIESTSRYTFGKPTGEDSDSDAEMMLFNAKYGDSQGSNGKKSTSSETETAEPEIDTIHESDSDSEMMSLLAKHGDNVGGQNVKEHADICEEPDSGGSNREKSTSSETEPAEPEVATGEDSDSDAEMMLLNGKYGDGHGSKGKKSTSSETESAQPEIDTIHESDSDSEMMSLLAKHSDNLGGKKDKEHVNICEDPNSGEKKTDAEQAVSEIATNPESDRDGEMMPLAAKHGGNLGEPKRRECVNISDESDSDSEMMSLIAKYGEHRGKGYAQVRTATLGNPDSQASNSGHEEATGEDSDSDAEMMSLLAKYGDNVQGNKEEKKTSAEAEPIDPEPAKPDSEQQSEIEEGLKVLQKVGFEDPQSILCDMSSESDSDSDNEQEAISKAVPEAISKVVPKVMSEAFPKAIIPEQAATESKDRDSDRDKEKKNSAEAEPVDPEAETGDPEAEKHVEIEDGNQESNKNVRDVLSELIALVPSVANGREEVTARELVEGTATAESKAIVAEHFDRIELSSISTVEESKSCRKKSRKVVEKVIDELIYSTCQMDKDDRQVVESPNDGIQLTSFEFAANTSKHVAERVLDEMICASVTSKLSSGSTLWCHVGQRGKKESSPEIVEEVEKEEDDDAVVENINQMGHRAIRDIIGSILSKLEIRRTTGRKKSHPEPKDPKRVEVGKRYASWSLRKEIIEQDLRVDSLAADDGKRRHFHPYKNYRQKIRASIEDRFLFQHRLQNCQILPNFASGPEGQEDGGDCSRDDISALCRSIVQELVDKFEIVENEEITEEDSPNRPTVTPIKDSLGYHQETEVCEDSGRSQTSTDQFFNPYMSEDLTGKVSMKRGRRADFHPYRDFKRTIRRSLDRRSQTSTVQVAPEGLAEGSVDHTADGVGGSICEGDSAESLPTEIGKRRDFHPYNNYRLKIRASIEDRFQKDSDREMMSLIVKCGKHRGRGDVEVHSATLGNPDEPASNSGHGEPTSEGSDSGAEMMNTVMLYGDSITEVNQRVAHASRCCDTGCQLPSCGKMKEIIVHNESCDRQASGGCLDCKQLVSLCRFHALLCDEPLCSSCDDEELCNQPVCPVPFCPKIKQMQLRNSNVVAQGFVEHVVKKTTFVGSELLAGNNPSKRKRPDFHPYGNYAKKIRLDIEQRFQKNEVGFLACQRLVHASWCCDIDCPLPSCWKMKRTMAHNKSCELKASEDCPVCKQFIALCSYHTTLCNEPKCPVPFCPKIKQMQLQHSTAVVEGFLDHVIEKMNFSVGECPTATGNNLSKRKRTDFHPYGNYAKKIRLDIEQRFQKNEIGYMADDETRDSFSSDDSDFSNPRTVEMEVVNQLIQLTWMKDHFLLKRTDFYIYPSYKRKIKLEIERIVQFQKNAMASRAQEGNSFSSDDSDLGPEPYPIMDVIASIMDKLERYEFRVAQVNLDNGCHKLTWELSSSLSSSEAESSTESLNTLFNI